ncbi:MAG: M14 family metallocarboxypeptidase [Bdellovibrionia bacterium]
MNRRPWSDDDKRKWFNKQKIQRSYLEEVVTPIQKLGAKFKVTQYGALSLNPEKYPLFLVQSETFSPNKKTVLITGGVHGYETSGVHGALAFMEQEASHYSEAFNFICAPAISPWAYETINRWNPQAIDPNRSFILNSPAEECRLFLSAVSSFLSDIYVHFDLHETTDTDNSIFRPEKALRDGTEEDPWSEIPDGFYAVGDTENPVPEFQKAVIDSVRKVTHIAPPDAEGKIIGVEIEQEGVINYSLKELSLCAGISRAKYTTTTEVYPDSPKANDAICRNAQMMAIKGGLDFILGRT